MEIIWYGHSCFKIAGGGLVVVTDPFEGLDQVIGSSFKIDVVTISHKHPSHASHKNLPGNPKIIDGPGEYEISSVTMRGLGTALSTPEDTHQINTIYVFEMEGIVVCHVGSLASRPSSREMDVMSDTGVLLLPVGGGVGLDAKKAADLANNISPKIVVPMHYALDGETEHLDGLEPFLKEAGVKEPEVKQKLAVSKTSIPSEMRVVVLEKAK